MSRKSLLETLQDQAKKVKNPKSLFVVGAGHADLIRSIFETPKK
jgi:hypothetical protein